MVWEFSFDEHSSSLWRGFTLVPFPVVLPLIVVFSPTFRMSLSNVCCSKGQIRWTGLLRIPLEVLIFVRSEFGVPRKSYPWPLERHRRLCRWEVQVTQWTVSNSLWPHNMEPNLETAQCCCILNAQSVLFSPPFALIVYVDAVSGPPLRYV